MKLFGNYIEISSTKIGQYPGDTAGDSIIATLKGSAEKGETAQVQGQTGIIGNPPKGAKGLRIRIGSLDIIISSLNYQVALPTNPGETKIYSTDADGVEKATQYLDKDGNHIFNSGTDFMVAYEDLVTQFNELKTAFNTHTHVSVTSLGSPTPPVPQSAADITTTKVPTMRVP